jgi:AcrR family transcriptional regulator
MLRVMSGRPRSVSDETIFSVVAEVIAQEGPTGLTLAAIGERAGLSAPALAQRFGTKRGLLLAYAARGQNFVSEAFDEATKANRSPTQALRMALEALTRPIQTRESLANNLAFLQMDLVDPDLRAHAVDQSREFRRRIEQLLNQAVQAGELTSGTNVTSLATSVYVTYNGALISWAIDGKGALRNWLRQSLDTVLKPYTRPDPEQTRGLNKTT